MEAISAVTNGYVRELITKGLRKDMRKMSDYRQLKITRGVLDNAEGSAEVYLGDTRVLAGVKMVLGEPMEDTPKEGTLVMATELLPLASVEYEAGPPTPDAIELGRVTDRGIRAGKCVDLESLFVEEGKVWSVYVDLYVLNYDGNLFDACEIAAMSALLNTKVPAYEDGKVVRERRVKELKIDNIVTSATFAKINGSMLLDPSGTEEAAAAARLSIATDGKFVRAMQKGLGGSFTVKEVGEMAEVALAKHAELRKQIENPG